MNTLPDDSQTPAPPAPPPNTPITHSGAKETEPGTVGVEGLSDATGQEVILPKEVAASGVRIRPTTIPIPPAVAQLGVQPVGQNVPNAGTARKNVPLSDVQIASGLKESIMDSIRWLAEWCKKRLKQIRIIHVNV